ncbi:MAG: hypothetical protein AB1333_01355 [Patescibacteria group bacterium]
MRKNVPGIIKENDMEMERMKNEIEKMTFNEKLVFYKNRKPNEYEKLLYVLRQKVEKPLNEYGGNGNTEDENRKFDSWTLNDIFLPEYLLGDSEIFNDLFPQAIMNSDCSWVERGWSENDGENEKLSSEWEKFVKNTLEENREKSVVLLVNCDS